MLDNISVTLDTLKEYNTSISRLMNSEQTDFINIVTNVKKRVYNDIKEDYISREAYVSNANADTALLQVKDLPVEQFLRERIAKLVIAEIYLQNEVLDLFDVWKNEAYNVPLKYYIDADSSNTAGDTELRKTVFLPGFSR